MTSFAQDLFSKNPNLKTESEILDGLYDVVKAQRGAKTARYLLSYTEDFAPDELSEYRWLQKQTVVA